MKVFLTADRIATLEIIEKYIPLNYGVLIPRNTSKNFLRRAMNLPHEKVLDSAIFHKDISPRDYLEMGKRYNFDMVLAQDVLFNKDRTVDKFRKLEEIYFNDNYPFEILPILQGKDAEEYVLSGEIYQSMGYKRVAIGGMLRAYIQCRRRNIDENLLFAILPQITNQFRDVFVLGAYSPKREEKLRRLGVWGSDFKGYMFRYHFGVSREERQRQIGEWILKNIHSYDSTTKTQNPIREVIEKVEVSG